MKLQTPQYPPLSAPLTVTILGGLAGSALLSGAVDPWLAPSLAPLAQGVSLAWLVRGVLWLLRCSQERHAWTHSPRWEITPDALARCQDGFLLGKAFAWTGVQTQFLETALAHTPGLPAAQDALGGLPVLHAVGQHAEQRCVIPGAALATHTLITGTTGCHAKGTKILMADGSVKAVEDLDIGDQVMGPDSRPRLVLRLHRGHDEMARIIPKKGEPFVVNMGHILSLMRTNDSTPHAGKVCNISVRQWLLAHKTFRHVHKLYRTGVTFPDASALPFHPYVIGVLLGDGCLTNATPVITNPDEEILAALQTIGAQDGFIVRVGQGACTANRCCRYSLTEREWSRTFQGKSPFRVRLEMLGLHGKDAARKSIPFCYKTASRDDRLELLAGLLDTDGYLGCNTYEFVSKSVLLAEDICHIARSLGLAAYHTPCEKCCQTGAGGRYYRVSISGDVAIIPCRVARKQAQVRGQKKSVLVTSFAVEPIGQDTYYGFECDQDHLYLTADFTVHHNSGKTTLLEILATQAIHQPGATIFLNPKGGREMLARCAVEARRAGKPFAALLASWPQHSHTMNVLATAEEPAEVAMRISAMMPPGGSEPFFREYPLAVLGRIAAAQQTLGIPWTLEELYRTATMQHALRTLVEAYLQHLGCSLAHGWKRAADAWRKAGGTDLILDGLLSDLDHDWGHFTKITATLNPTFHGVVGAPRGHLFSSLTPDITWQRIADEQMVVYIDLASLLLGEIAQRIGRMLLQDLLGFVGRRYVSSLPETRQPLTVFIDEAARVVYPQFPIAVGMSRGANVRFILARQSSADFEAVLASAPLARQIEDNCQTQIWMQMASETHAQETLTDAMDTAYVRRPETSTGLGYGGVGGLSGHTGLRLAGLDMALVRPSWLTGLPRGQAFVRLQGQLLKLRIPRLAPMTRKDVATVGLLETYAALPAGNAGQYLT